MCGNVYCTRNLSVKEMIHVIWLGCLTLFRVCISTFLGALWTIPVGVAIGFHPRLSRIMQPIVQILSSFPANMVFPFLTILYVKYGVNFELGSIPLMMLGTQWYILFNVIAGAMAIPSDLREAADLLCLTTTINGDISLTKIGHLFAEGSVQERKELFRKQVLEHIPMMATVVNVLHSKANKTMNREFFIEILNQHYNVEESEKQLDILIDWGRYADLFDYDEEVRQLFIEE